MSNQPILPSPETSETVEPVLQKGDVGPSGDWRRFWDPGVLGRLLALVLIFTFFAFAVQGGSFYKLRNLESVLRQSAVYATAALGMTMIIIAGGIDLSIGSVIALTGVVVAWVLTLPQSVSAAPAGSSPANYWIHDWPVLLPCLAVLAGVGAATLAGLLNGLFCVGLRIVPFVVTLGTMMIYRGLAKIIAQERPIYPPASWLSGLMDPTLTTQSPQRWMLLPPGVWLLLLAAVVAAVMLRYTRLGRHIYAVGSNAETARLCGVSVGRTKIIVYTLGGFFGGLAGLMEFSWIGGVGIPTTATGYELAIIAAVVIGGGSLSGGEGSILGSLIGALIITVLSMGGQQMGWPRPVQEMAIGAILIGAVALDYWQRRWRRKE
ncbi:MAG TPA: ABC transporter permease [Thermoguttaceae bacterium]|nr:ABC transporter permease [Thermoguttaceae bacterium]HPP52838.1 ABC transporter permease [Thermoguttaceae bacterium]